MGVDFQVTRFQKDASGTNGVTQDVTLNFTPKAIIVFTAAHAVDDTFAEVLAPSYGFSDGTNQACVAVRSVDNIATSDTGGTHRTDSCVAMMVSSTPATVTVLGSAAFITNGVRFTWTDNDTNALWIYVVAFAGSDITNVKVNTVDVADTLTGAHNYTGLGFTPTNGNAILFTCGNNTVNTNTGESICSPSIGCATSTTKRWALANCLEDGRATSDTWRYFSSARCIASLVDTTGAIDYLADFNSWITDGFQLDIEDASASATNKFSYMVINGGKWDAGTETINTGTGSETTTVDSALVTMRGVFTATHSTTIVDSVTGHSHLGIGVSDGTNEGCMAFIERTALANAQNISRHNNAGILMYGVVTTGTTPFTPSVVIQASFTSFGTNSFTYNHDVAAGAAHPVGWWAVGESASTLFERSINEATISVSDSNARTLMANRSLSEASISVSDTNTRVLTAFRTLSETSISVNETLERLRLVTSTITEPAISVSETLARQLIATRVLSEASISVSDTLARMLSAFRTLAEPSISVNDVVVGAKFSLRTINEAAISVSDALTRTLSAFRTLSEPSITVSETLARMLLAFRTLSESSISVNETLARTVIFPRSISEPSISVNETLARQLIATRVLSEASISVSDTLNRVLSAFRTISEPSISVSETLTEIGIFPRTINESTISVSETLARMLSAFRTLSEASISVSDSLLTELISIQTRSITEPAISVSDAGVTRRLSAFRTLAEASIAVSDSVLGIPANLHLRSITEPAITVSDLIASIRTFPPLATYIVDPGYTNSTKVRITFKSKIDDDTADESGDQIIYYQYDAFHYDTRPFNILNFSLRLVQGEVSIATLDIEDSAQNIIDRSKISFNAVVEIDFKKENGRDWTRVMTGYVRRLGVMRPATNALMYRVTVLSKQIVYNERVTNFKRAAKRTAIDSAVPLSTDSKMHANRLFEELHTATDILPLKKPTIQQTGDFLLNTGSISDEVSDFIAEIAPGLGIASDVANAIAEVTGAIWGVDEFGNPYLRYPTEKHSGIIIKDDPQDTDSALNTSVNMDSFEFEDSIDQSEGFANRLYVLNSKDTKSTASSSKASGKTTLTTRWIAQSFIATDNNITGAAFILSKIGNPTNTTGSIKGVLRANSGSQNFPTGATLATFEISLSELSNSADVIFVNDIKTETGVIIPGNRYWWVLQGTGLIDDTHTVRWHHDNDLVTADRLSATLPFVDADPTTPGIQLNWIRKETGPIYAFSTFSSVNHILTQSDSESIKKNGLIEAVVNLPAFDDDATFQKALVKILQTSAKVKRIFEYARVTIPTAKFFLPGELVTVIDSKAKLNSEKVINAEIVEVSYNFDANTNAMGVKYADLRLIGFIDSVVDDYLENREC